MNPQKEVSKRKITDQSNAENLDSEYSDFTQSKKSRIEKNQKDSFFDQISSSLGSSNNNIIFF